MPGGVLGMGGDIGSELRCRQVGLLVTHNGQRTAHGGHGPPPVSPGQTGYSFCLPGGQPSCGGPAPAPGPGPVQFGGGGLEVAGSEPQPAGHGVRHDGPVGEAHSFQPGGGLSGKCGQGAMVILLGRPSEPGPCDGRLGQGLPTTPLLSLEQCRGLLGRRPRRLRIAAKEGDVGQHHQALGQVLVVTATAELIDGLLGDDAAIAEQAGSH